MLCICSVIAAVQVDLVNLLDLNLLQTNEDDEDDGVEMDKSALTGGDHHLQEKPESLISKSTSVVVVVIFREIFGLMRVQRDK